MTPTPPGAALGASGTPYPVPSALGREHLGTHFMSLVGLRVDPLPLHVSHWAFLATSRIALENHRASLAAAIQGWREMEFECGGQPGPSRTSNVPQWPLEA